MDTASDDCGCGAGTGTDTPATKGNAPGLSAIRYRVGTWSAFRSTLLARLSGTDFPPLAGLTTRDSDDWSIALIDSFCCVADVLTFYQERIANESWLRTATERRSVMELARLIGYQLAPGVAASTALAYTLETSPGHRASAARPVTIAAGSKVQSVPDPDQDPQTFETVEPVTARVEWNAIPAQTGETVAIAAGLTELYIAGTNNSIQQGDAILIVGRERILDPASEAWDVRWIDAVEPDTARSITRLSWSDGLGEGWSLPSHQGIHVFVFRQRASLFGSNAPQAALLYTDKHEDLFDVDAASGIEWANFRIDATGQKVDLDSSYPKIVRHSWVALTGGSHSSDPTGYIELYRVQAVSQLSRSGFGLSAKITRLKFDGAENLGYFGLRESHVLAHSDELERVQRPLKYPVLGSTLTLGEREAGLQPAQLIAVTGKRQRVMVPADATGITRDDDTPVTAGDSFILLAAPQKEIAANQRVPLAQEELDVRGVPDATWHWSLLADDGTSVAVTSIAGTRLDLQPALDDDDVVSEVVTLVDGADAVTPHLRTTALSLATPLANCYDRATVVVNANVARATHGETVGEPGGNGDAARPNQAFVLKQTPLTYVSSSTEPGGAASTLQVRVGDVLWQERSTLYGAGAKDRVYTLRQDDSARTTVKFGDGDQGARLPSGQNNLRFTYRKGLGAGANLRAGQLSTLLSRPLGVKGVTNPAPSSGGQDAETLSRARANAPLRVLTLDRAVSAQDYADFSRAFAGVDKAQATWIGSGRARGIHVTVAGSGGSAIPQGGTTQVNLVAALRRYGDPLLPLTVQSFRDARFTLGATVKVDPEYDFRKVLKQVGAALRLAYAFDARDFGQQVTLDDVYAVIQAVPGVVASDIQQLYRTDQATPATQPQPRLVASLPEVQGDGTVTPAELLTLDDGPLQLGAMS